MQWISHIRRLLPAGGLILLLALPYAPAAGQVTWSGQASADILKSAPSGAPRQVNGGRPTFGWESDLFLDAIVSDDIAVLSTTRVNESEQIYFDYFAIRLTDVTPLGLNIQAGKFDLPFGNLSDRRFPRNNPLYGLPLLYEYQTSIVPYPPTTYSLLNNRGRGAGLRLLDGGMYDIGAMVFGAFDIFTYSLAVSNGTVSTPAYGNQNTNNDFGKTVRITATPAAGLTIGAAYSWGAYLYDQSQAGIYRQYDAGNYQQSTAEVDLSFSYGHFVFYGEGVYGSWNVPLEYNDVTLSMAGYYAEGKYTIMPRLYVALRYNGLLFHDADFYGTSLPWDYNVTEWEGGIGYFLDRNVLVKVVRRETRTYGGTMPKDFLTVLQLAAAF